MRRALVVTVLALSLIPASPNATWACSCASATPFEYVRAAQVIFTGLALDGTPRAAGNAGAVSVHFEVRSVFKGNVGPRTVLRTSAQTSACGAAFSPGRVYTVFARLTQSYLMTSSCSGNTAGDIVPTEYGLRGAIVTYEHEAASQPDPAEEDRDGAVAEPWLIPAGIGSIAGIALYALLRRRRKTRASTQ